MKGFIKIALIAAGLLLSVSGLRADCKYDGWRERVRAEKVAFLTTELNLTAKEAEAFWPVYNQVSEKREKAFGEVRNAYKDMKDAVDANKSEKEVGRLLNKYVEALGRTSSADKEYLARFRKVLPADKVAKLYLSEERFRRQQIHKLRDKQPK